ncbi:alpha/beta fold hydrolase [Mesorhizobium sp.]|uniref:alpha/beta hydrolase n=1 Tax=Mesorhizobium sp. TaxID=1871066 RepID=UPI0025C5990D|nr:alpha/beta fold hydrolase [Mesorhizobium sp.]
MGRRIVLAVLGLAVILFLAFVLGPRVQADTTIRFDPSVIGDDPQAYLVRKEAAVPGIYDGLEKEIIWADPMVHARTPLSIVYIHGFSASKGEVRPLPDEVADQLDANLYYTRLTGHGQGGAAMAEGSVNAWINDYEEALAIGRAIGDKVIVIATSTGGSLAAWAATQPDASEGMAAVVFISPNFGVKASGRRTPDHAVGPRDRRAGRRQGAQLRATQCAAREILDPPLSDRGDPADGGADRACLWRAGGEGDHPCPLHLFGFGQDRAVRPHARNRRALGRRARTGASRRYR